MEGLQLEGMGFCMMIRGQDDEEVKQTKWCK